MSKLIDRQLNFFGFCKQDYLNMFDLAKEPLDDMHILDCFGGFNTFNLEIKDQVERVVTIDSLYNGSKQDLELTLDASKENLLKLMQNHQKNFVWANENTPKLEVEQRIQVAEQFLENFTAALAAKEIMPQDFPHLTFRDEAFDLALCSHFLFTQTQAFDLHYHLSVIEELMRVADEIRIFPLVDKLGNISEHLGPVLQTLQDKNMDAKIQEVPYEFLQGGNAMLIIDTDVCEVAAHEDENIIEE